MNSNLSRSIFTPKILKWAILIAFLIAAILTAVLTFNAVRDFFAAWQITSLPGIPVVNAKEATPAPGTPAAVIKDPQQPLQPVGGPTPAPWDGASRVTLLVMGLDYRDWISGQGAPRTDTMMLLTFDPLTQTAGMISIPRDLWVNIPGFEYGRINTAYSLGEQYKLPGGGPGLAMKTVEELLGVPVDYYAVIDFGAFVKFVDEIGGVKVDIKEPITVDPLNGNTKKLKPGRQTLNGELALAYARVRKNAGDDFGRADRQQQVVLGLREEILKANSLPKLLPKAPALYQELSAGIHTNLNLEQVLQLAWMAQQLPDDKIKRGVIAPPDMVLLAKTDTGDDVLKPIFDKIREMRDKVFTEAAPVSPAAASMQPVDLMKAEAAKISVLNGSSSTGLAAKTQDYLKSQGANIVNTGNAEQLYNYTTVFDYTGKPYTVKYLVDLMGISPNQIYSRYDPTSQVDVVVTVGQDWAANNKMP